MALGFSSGVVARSKAVYEADTKNLEAGARRAEKTVRGSSSSIGRDLDRQAKGWGSLGKAAGVAAKAATIAFAAIGAAAVLGAKKAVVAASDLEEQINKVSVVFRGSEKDVIEWSKTTASSIGISQRAALEAAGTFGNMLVPMGFARDEAAKMSTRMVQLAADMASFNNADPTAVLEALRSGLAGETEPLRKFGIFLNDARLKQEALNLGLYDGKGALDAAAKAQATYAVILKDSADAQGDFGRTSDSLANQQRILKAELENAAAAAGKVLLPAVAAVLGVVTALIPRVAEWVGEMSERLQPTIERLSEFVTDTLVPAFERFFTELLPGAIATAVTVVGGFVTVLGKVADAVGGWDVAFALILGGTLAVQVGRLATTIVTQLVGSLVATQAAAANAGTSMTLMGAAGAAAIKTIRAALITTGVGALIVGLGIGATLVITHWKQVEGYFRAFGKTMFEIGKSIVAWLIRPFVVGLATLINMIAEIVETANSLPLIGKAIPDGLVKGLNSAQEHVNSFVESLTPDFGGVVEAWRKGGEDAGTAFAQAAGAAAAGSFTGFPGLGGNPLTPQPGGPTGGQFQVGGALTQPVPGRATPAAATHPTSGLGGFPAVDIMAPGGTPVVAPENGRIVRVSGSPPSEYRGGSVVGYSIYFEGDSGTTYFMTHFSQAAPVGNYRAGQVIGYIATWPGDPGRSHLHLGIKEGSPVSFGDLAGAGQARKPSAASGTAGTQPTTPTSETAAATATGPTPTVEVEKVVHAAQEEVQAVAAKVKFAYNRLSDIPADAARQLRPKLADLARILSRPVTPETLAEVEKQAKRYNAQLSRVIEGERIAAEWRKQRAELQRLLDLDVFPPAREAKIRQQIGQLDKQIAAVTKAVIPKPGDLARAKAGLARLADVADQGIETLRNRVAASRAKFDRAWGQLTDIALRAFDEQTARLVAAVRVKMRSVVDGINEAWTFGEGLKTPSEILLEKEESARAKAAAEQARFLAEERVREAQAAVLAAQAEGGEKMLEAEQELYDAQQELDELNWQERRALLEQAAADERAMAEQRLADAQSVVEERRRLDRVAFEAELAELGVQVATKQLTYGEAMGKLRDLFAEYEVPFAERGSALSAALGFGMQAAMGAVHDAIKELRDAVADLVAAIGGKVTEAERLAARAAAARRAVAAQNEQLPPYTGVQVNPDGTFSVGGARPFAEGGEVNRPTLAVVGEAGLEFVLPARKVPPWARPWLFPWLRRMIGGRSGGGMFGIPALASGGMFGDEDDDWRDHSGAWPGWEPPSPSQSQLAAAARYAIFAEYGGDLFSSRAGALGPFVAPAGGGRGDLGGMLRAIQQQITMVFQQPPADPFVYFERARHQARAFHRG